MKDLWSGRVLLVNPPHSVGTGYMLGAPIGLFQVALWIQDTHGHSLPPIQIVDMALLLAQGVLKTGEGLIQTSVDLLHGYDVDTYGFSVQCFNLPIAVEIARRLKEACSSRKIIFGGHQASILGERLSKSFPWIDLVLSTPILVHESAEYAARASRIINQQAYYDVSLQPTALVQSGVGCPFNCSFCCIPTVHGRQVTQFPIVDVIQAVECALKSKSDISVHFVDDIFTICRTYTTNLMDALRTSLPTISWTCMTRVDLVDPDLLAEMSDAGCYSILYGVDGASSESQLTLHKGGRGYPFLPEFLQWNTLAGIRPTLYFLIGFPGETESQMWSTIETAARLSVFDPGCTHIQLPRLNPGSELRNRVKDDELTLSFDTPYAQTLSNTIGKTSEAWDLVRHEPSIFSTYYLGGAESERGRLVTFAWATSSLMKRHPITLVCLIELGLHEQLGRNMETVFGKHGPGSHAEFYVASLKTMISEEVPVLTKVLEFEDRYWPSAGQCNPNRNGESFVDIRKIEAAINLGEPLLPVIYA